MSEIPSGPHDSPERYVAIYNGTFLLGQTLMPGINALLLGTLMYRSRLVPRVIPVLGLIGGPLLITAVSVTLLSGGTGTSPRSRRSRPFR